MSPELRQEHRAGLVRGGATAVITFGITTLTTYSAAGEWEAALIAGGVSGLTALAAFFGLSVADAKRNDAKP